jgi:arylsulfatase A-like enzyme
VVQWRRALPPRDGWLRLLASPTSAVLCAALLLTVQAKIRILASIEGAGFWPLLLPWAVAMDAVVYLGFAAMFAVGEGRSPWLALATYPLTALLLALAVINASYLSITGEQLTWQTIQLGFDRIGDLGLILGEQYGKHVALALAGIAAVVGLPWLVRRWVVRRHGPWRRGVHDRRRAHAAAAVSAVALVVALVWPTPSALPAQRLGGNAAVGTYWSWLTAPDDEVLAGDLFEGYRAPRLVGDAELARVRAAPDRKNVLLVILESTRFDHTSLAGERGKGTQTPQLAALARAGTSATSARAVLPHTTKSVFSMLCGRFPLMQLGMIEYSHDLDVQCAPAALTAAGWRTAFLQSAWGTFEERTRLVDKLGFEHFEGWEDIQGESVGYLASDDLSLVDPAARWLDSIAGGGAPFFLTVLTSAAHHPYRLPASIDPRGADSDEQRFARIVETEDELLGRLLALLDARGLRDDTIVVVLGDHGEGFGGKGVRQHDNNYYEEGLHVPFVLAGPGIPAGEIAAPVTLADLAPTLLGRLGVRIEPDAERELAGIDLFAAPVPPDRTVYFSCYYELRCRGFVRGTDKVVVVPQTGRGYHFDLAADPDENRPRPVPADLRARIPDLMTTLDEFQTRSWQPVLGPTRAYGPWRCEPGHRCTHPNARELRL